VEDVEKLPFLTGVPVFFDSHKVFHFEGIYLLIFAPDCHILGASN
jgi:hypothetical protein